MNVTFDSLFSVIKRSGLLTTEAITAQLQAYRQTVADHSPRGFADFLVDRNLLTRWQADKLYDGKHKGFFLGKYRLLTLLGRGGMSTVYLAEHVLMKRLCAVKVLPWKNVKDSSSLKRFHVEAQAAASLDHPNIVRAYDIDHEVDGQAQIHFLVMEYVEGQNLYELVQNQGPVPPGIAANYTWQAAQGLQHAHAQGMVHRDIKPGNLIVDKHGQLKVMDLGLARILQPHEEGSLTKAHDERVLGTADYLSPEQAVDSHEVDARADLYGLGCTMFYLLNGVAPFRGGSLAQRILAHQTKEPPAMDPAQVPASLQSIIYKLMAKRPEDRYDSAEELSNALIGWLDKNDPAQLPEDHRNHPKQLAGKTSVKLSAATEGTQQSRSASGADLNAFLNQLTTDEHPESSSHAQPSASSASEVAARSAHRKPAASKAAPGSSFAGIQPASTERVPSSPRSHRNRGTAFPKGLPWIFGGVALLVFTVWFGINTFGERNTVENVSPGPAAPAANASPVPASGTSTAVKSPASPVIDPQRKVEGTTLLVGKSGHFSELADAVAFIQRTLDDSGGTMIKEIKIASGSVLTKSLVLDNSGFLVGFPRGIRIIGEGPTTPVLRVPGSAPLISLHSIEQLVIENLELDCSGHDSAIDLQGYLLNSQLRNLKLKGLASVGMDGRGAAGLLRRPLTIANCQFHAVSPSAVGIRCSGSDANDTRQLVIEECRFLGPAATGIQFLGTTWDVTIRRSIFHQQRQGVLFSSNPQDLNGLSFVGNTFCAGQAGISFGFGPSPAASRMTFIRNLFVRLSGGDVLHGAPVNIEQLTRGAQPSTGNWTDRESLLVDQEIDIYAAEGTRSPMQFVTEDPLSPGFLKPVLERTGTARQNFSGAVAP